MELDGKLVPILHGIPSNDFHRIPYDSTADLQTGSRKNAPPTGGHVFLPIYTIFELVRDINKTNVLTNFHDDWAKIVTSRVLTKKTAPPGSHVFQLTGTIFKINCHIKATNVLTKFHENTAKNVTSRRFTCFHYIHIEKNAPPTGCHVFSPIWTIFKLVRDINKNNVLTNFHDEWANIVTSRVYTRKTAPPPGSHETNVLTKFHENWAKNVTSRVEKCPSDWRPYINKTNVLTNFHDDWAKIVTSRKNSPPTGGHVLSPIWTIFELFRDIKITNVLTNFHDDWAKIMTSRPCYSTDRNHFKLNSYIKETNVLTKFHENWAKHVTSRTIFKLVRDINKTNVLTNFHDDWAKIVTSRPNKENCPPPGSHETNVLTKFHENWAKNVTSRTVHIEKFPAHWRPCFFTDLDDFRTRPRYQ
ncbi:hypothetical protein DPMN_156402 [Dreissena polymorpha]|uniref:Uncharacterized protein n=1 Tax=Dreissena polymorpha TaxID=45954 RepID=A0A9D4FQP4_DREPO|nr:hypothetical protein DPMN_156402 [Dreissena polymorpha]